MKRFLFVVVSAFFTVTSFAANLGRDVISKVSNSQEVSLTQADDNGLVLEFPSKVDQKMKGHYSHSSHSSHRSHSSHSSHYSSRW